MLTYGIPSFKLQKDVIEAEVEIIRLMGAEFRYGVEVGRDVTLDELREQGLLRPFMLPLAARAAASPVFRVRMPRT